MDTDQVQGKTIPTFIDVSFIDLSKINPPNMKKRMRPLFFFGGGKKEVEKGGIYEKFSVNGHFDFHEGGTDMPVIGSTEDWYFINTNFFAPHPIHIHLINYQIQHQY